MIAVGLFWLGAAALFVPARAVRPALRAGAAAVTGAALAWVLCPVPVLVVVAALLAAATPAWLAHRRASAARLRARAAWPEAIDTIRAAVRSGATVAEAVAEPGRRRVGAQSELAGRFAIYRQRVASGELFDTAVTALADPGDEISHRVVAVLRLAADVGSADVGRVLAAQSAFVRAQLAQDREIAARQQWNVTAARVAVAAPWLTVALLSAQPDARAAYASATGGVLLAVVAVVSAGAYALMMRAGRVTS